MVRDDSCTWEELTVSVASISREWQEYRRKDVWHGREKDPHCTLPAWISRRSWTWQGRSILRTLWLDKTPTDGLQQEHLERKFRFTRCIRQGHRRSDTALAQTGNTHVAECGKKVEEGRMEFHLDELRGESHQLCSILYANNNWAMSHSKEHLQQMISDQIEEAARCSFKPKAASLWW